MASERGRIDPDLLRQLDAGDSDEAIEAVVVFRPPPGRAAPQPEQTETLSKELLTRVERTVGHGAGDVNVLRNLGRVVVAADAPFVRELLKQPEVDAVYASRRGG